MGSCVQDPGNKRGAVPPEIYLQNDGHREQPEVLDNTKTPCSCCPEQPILNLREGAMSGGSDVVVTKKSIAISKLVKFGLKQNSMNQAIFCVF